MKCEKHGCELVRETRTSGWNKREVLVCPQCAAERRQAVLSNRVTLTSGNATEVKNPHRRGW
jgi:hypothetical protein